MTVLVLHYCVLFLLATAIGFVAGAGVHRAALGAHLMDLDGDVQGLRARLREAKAALKRD